jgi:hypothetical protein
VNYRISPVFQPISLIFSILRQNLPFPSPNS